MYEEDSNGKVLDRLLLPRPTDDPNDPLVSTLFSLFRQRQKTEVSPVDVVPTAQNHSGHQRVLFCLSVQLHHTQHITHPHLGHRGIRRFPGQGELLGHLQPPLFRSGQFVLGSTVRKNREEACPSDVLRPLFCFEHLGRRRQVLGFPLRRPHRARLRGQFLRGPGPRRRRGPLLPPRTRPLGRLLLAHVHRGIGPGWRLRRTRGERDPELALGVLEERHPHGFPLPDGHRFSSRDQFQTTGRERVGRGIAVFGSRGDSCPGGRSLGRLTQRHSRVRSQRVDLVVVVAALAHSAISGRRLVLACLRCLSGLAYSPDKHKL